MLLDWLVFGLLVFGVAKLLNVTAFKTKPASSSATWGLTIAAFFLNLVALSFIKVLRYKAISDSLGGTIFPDNPIDWIGAFAFTTLFFSFLRREHKNQTTASPQKSDLTELKPPLPQDLPPNSEPHPKENGRPSIQTSSHKNYTHVWEAKFLILIIVFLVAGVVGGISLIYLFSDSEEGAWNKLTELNIAFNRETFIEKIKAGDIVAVRLFLKAGVSPNGKDKHGRTALMLASINGNQMVAEVLLRNGADINITESGKNYNRFAITALDCAEMEGHVELAKFLRSKGGLKGSDAWSKRFNE